MDRYVHPVGSFHTHCCCLSIQELSNIGGKNTKARGGRKGGSGKTVKENVTSGAAVRAKVGNGVGGTGSSRLNVRGGSNRGQHKGALKAEQAAGPLVKEEGEMSDDEEEVYEQFKEVKWMEWCEDVMVDEVKTLNRLHRLQTTSANLPKDKVLARIRNYLQLIGRRIDGIVLEHEREAYKQDRMTMRLWKYVSTFSNLSGERLHQIYSKLKKEQDEEVGPSSYYGKGGGEGGEHYLPYSSSSQQQQQQQQRGGHRSNNSSSYHQQQIVEGGGGASKLEAWKRRRRSDSMELVGTAGVVHRNSSSNWGVGGGGGGRVSDPSALGILGAAPSDHLLVRRMGDERLPPPLSHTHTHTHTHTSRMQQQQQRPPSSSSK